VERHIVYYKGEGVGFPKGEAASFPKFGPWQRGKVLASPRE
jgi:hypothetical protein